MFILNLFLFVLNLNIKQEKQLVMEMKSRHLSCTRIPLIPTQTLKKLIVFYEVIGKN